MTGMVWALIGAAGYVALIGIMAFVCGTNDHPVVRRK